MGPIIRILIIILLTTIEYPETFHTYFRKTRLSKIPLAQDQWVSEQFNTRISL